ncbi:MAG: nitroreductase family protein [Elusimicrobia bacterium]|nr:nitroreductase family protein [Elusimicrobiota bacterium]
MTFLELVKNRYSCRSYKDLPVEKDKIDRCLEAARLSPSACNAQPWEFIIIDDSQLRDSLAEKAAAGIYRFSRFICRAPVIIVVSADKGSFLSKAGSFVRSTDFYLLDIGIACEHLVLQATELGLGTCYIGWFDDKAVKKLLGIPGKRILPLLICMGYPDDTYKPKDPIRRRAVADRRKPLSETAFFNREYR